jgi:secondary thiamine-phosphate synthase enzyme
MELVTNTIEFRTQGNTDIIDITSDVQDLVAQSGLTEGSAAVFVIGSTAGITTVEYEPGLVKTDLPELLNKFAPYGKNYAHNKTWGCDNGASHLRSSLIGSSLTVPFINQSLCLGTWQQVILIDFDTRPRSRNVVVQLTGK